MPSHPSASSSLLPAYLALDFDGVLSPGNTGTLRYAEALGQLLDEFDDSLKVVLSTNWRETHSYEGLLDWLPGNLRRRVVGALPVLPCGQERGGRQVELQAWLATHPCRAVLAVDDTASLFQPGCPYLFLTRSRDALDRETLAELRLRLKELLG